MSQMCEVIHMIDTSQVRKSSLDPLLTPYRPTENPILRAFPLRNLLTLRETPPNTIRLPPTYEPTYPWLFSTTSNPGPSLGLPSCSLTARVITIEAYLPTKNHPRKWVTHQPTIQNYH